MSHVDDLIAERCPRGVEFKALGCVAKVARGASPRPIQAFLTDASDGVPWIKIGDVDPEGKYITNTAERITPAGAVKSRRIHVGDFVLSNSMSFGRPYISAIEGCIHDGWLAISGFEGAFVADFLYHLLRSTRIQAEFTRRAGSGTVRNLNADIVKSVEIPAPPIEVQREIVEILDKFTSLEAELDAELDARRRQYEYYRDALLTFAARERVRWLTLDAVGRWYGGGTPSKSVPEFWADGTVPWLSPKDMVVDTIATTADHVSEVALERSPLKLVPAGSVAVVVRSNILRRRMPVALVSVPMTLNQDMRAVVPNDGVLPEYLFQVCRANADRILSSAGRTDGSMAAIQSKGLLEFAIPVPEMAEQRRITRALSRFDALVNDLSVGLPAELNARRQQYEYYRDRLLTFAEAA